MLRVKNMHPGSPSDPSWTAATQGEAELRLYNLKKHHLPQSQSQAVVCVNTPRMIPRSGYILVIDKSNFHHKVGKIGQIFETN